MLGLIVSASAPGGFITTYGHFQQENSPWIIDVSPDKLAVAHVTSGSPGGRITTMVGSQWKAHPGWFVFVESAARLWVYNGTDDLFFERMTDKGRLMAELEGSFDTIPELPPKDLLARLPAQMQTALHAKFSSPQ